MKPIRVLLSLITVVSILFASTLSAKAISFEAETVYESVFIVYSGNSMGSGFAVGENCIVTNAHVIENTRNVFITTYGGDQYQATVLGVNEEEDIAVLVVRNISFPYLPVADVSEIKTGDNIYAIGSPKGMAYTLTTGVISAKEREIRNQSYIQIDAPINEGNSGGPLLNDFGEVLGMNTLKISDGEGLGFAIPIARICNYLSTLGIELSTNGNVTSNIEIPESTPPVNVPETSTEDNTEHKENDSTDVYEDKHIATINYALVVVAVLSLICNIVLAVLLIYQKKKKTILQYDPSERTDFEIDVWE